MENTFFIDYKNNEKVMNGKTPYGLIIDLDELGEKRLNIFLNKMYKDQKYINNNVKKIILKMDYQENLFKNIDITDNIYFIFNNEESLDIRMSIMELSDTIKKHIIGKKICTTGVDILLYRVIGIKNIFVGSPLINDADELKMLQKIGYTLYAIPNIINSLIGFRDPNWIRPEGIKLYPNINNWVLYSSDNKNIKTILNAYYKGGYVGPVKNYLINFDNSYNKDINIINFFNPTFDIKKTICKANCQYCDSCNRELQINHQMTNYKK